MQRTLIIVLATVALGACETAGFGQSTGPGPAYTPPSRGGPESFQESDFAWSEASGGGSIDGLLAYRNGGARYACQDVVLAPETPWSRARMRILYLSTSQAAMPVDDVKSRTPPEHGAEYARYARHARYARYARCADHHAHTPPSGRFLGERAELPDRRGKHRQSLLG